MLQKRAGSLDIGDHKELPAVEEPKHELPVLWDENDDAEFVSEDDLLLHEDEAPKSDDLDFLDENEHHTDDVELFDEEEPQTDDVELLAEGPTEQDYEELFGIEDAPEKSPEPFDWRSTPHDFFCVCLDRDGLALTVLFKDKTTKGRIWMLCTCCNQVFVTMSDIRKHSSMTRPRPEYWCRSCGIYFSSIDDLKVHENYRNHKLKISGMVIRCLKCSKISTQLSNAVRHDNIVHDRSFYECETCKVSFHSRDLFKKHQWNHKHLTCRYPKCQRKFQLWEQYASHLSWHKRTVSRCLVPGCTVTMLPGDHVKHLRTHSKNQVKFYRIS